MSDLAHLPDQAQTLIHIKQDGLIEACVHTATAQGLGLSEALDLMLGAVMRELMARRYDRAQAEGLVSGAMDRTWPAVIESPRRLAS